MDSQLNLKDLAFIEDLSPEMSEMIYDICVMNINDILTSLEHPDNVDDKFVKEIPEDKLEEMLVFYRSMLDVFIEKERYENCRDVKYVIESLEKYSKKVATYQ
jgi:hypothetical protein